MNRQKKASLETLYSRLGMTLPEAVNIFFENSLLVGGLPFDVRIPKFNHETDLAIQEVRDIMTGKKKQNPTVLPESCLKSWMKNNAYSQNNFQIQKRLNKKDAGIRYLSFLHLFL